VSGHLGLERLTRVQPNDSGAWRTLVNAYYQKSGAQAALSAIRREPVVVGAKLNRDAEYLALLASIYRDRGNQAESRKAFEQAVATIRTQRIEVSSGLKLELAGLYVQHAAPLDAAAAYQRILDQEAENLSAWEGYMAALNNAKAYSRAARSREQLPATVRSSALTRPGFLRAVAATYLGMGGLGTAEALLVRSRELESASGMRPSFYTEFQLAQLLLGKRGISARD
jgi:tetratricopeptide (TPR) repeat protein